MKDIKNDPTSILYQNEFLSFFEECIEFADLLWGEDQYDRDYLEEVCLARYRQKDRWHFVDVLHEVRKDKQRKKKK
jgi:hypothetical protein